MTEAQARIEVRAVVKVFDRGPERRRVLDGLSFTVDAGEVVVVSGPSGSGKSTLFDILLGWQEVDEGSAEIVAARPGGVAVIPQQLGLFTELTAEENVELGGNGERGDVVAMLDRLEIDDVKDRMTRQLSLGQQQRVAIARALAARPQVVIADEPTSHQDGDRADVIMDVLREAAAQGAVVLLSSHDPRLIARCDREIRLDRATAESSVTADSVVPRRLPPGLVTLAVAIVLTVVLAIALAGVS